MKKAIFIIGGLLALGVGVETILDKAEPTPLPITPVFQKEEVSFDQVYPTIDKYISNVERIIQNCEGDRRCVITRDGRKLVEVKSFNSLINDNPKIYAK